MQSLEDVQLKETFKNKNQKAAAAELLLLDLFVLQFYLQAVFLKKQICWRAALSGRYIRASSWETPPLDPLMLIQTPIGLRETCLCGRSLLHTLEPGNPNLGKKKETERQLTERHACQSNTQL